jgi:IS1 family transposase/transposase-like protein
MHYGQINQGNIISISTYMTKSGKRHIFRCNTCNEAFSETRDTAFFDLKTEEKKVIMALKMILVKVDITGIAFVLDVKEDTVLFWLDRAYKKANEINQALLKELPVTRVELDEMWSFVRRKTNNGEEEDPVYNENDSSEAEKSEEGQQWTWISFAPEYRLILGIIVGPRTFETALSLIALTASIVMGVPCYFSDGFSCYYNALLTFYHQIKVFPRTGKPGRPKDPVKEPHPDLVYAQVVKEKKKGRLVGISHRIRCGAKRLANLGFNIGTSFLERLNLTIRQSLAPFGRKTLSFSKKKENLEKQIIFFQAFYNFARPHMSLREKISDSDERFQKKWRLKTPAMAASITDHVWEFRELLTYKYVTES